LGSTKIFGANLGKKKSVTDKAGENKKGFPKSRNSSGGVGAYIGSCYIGVLYDARIPKKENIVRKLPVGSSQDSKRNRCRMLIKHLEMTQEEKGIHFS